MSIIVTAVFQNGVLVPDWKLDLPEGAEVVITVREITKEERQRLIAEHNRQIEHNAK
jgi:predicted DNA-binding antitoxin AbrB/MazE fold protein